MNTKRFVFPKTLKPTLTAIAEAAAAKTGPICEADLDAAIDTARTEFYELRR